MTTVNVVHSKLREARWSMVSALDYRSNGLGWSPGQEYCVVFLGKTVFRRI